MLRPVLLCIVLLHCFNISSANDEESSSCQAATLSCEDIKNYWPESSSGYYNIVSKGDERRYMYCNMEKLNGSTSLVNPSSIQPTETVLTSSELKDSSSTVQPTEILFTSSLPIEASSVHFPLSSSVMPHQTNVLPEPCGSGGGWTRLAYLNMSDATQNCPSGFRLYQSGGVRACGRTNDSASCVSVQFPSNGISYSQICGRVTGYQYRSGDAFLGGSNDINVPYVDGVSITRGSPRQHVWTLACSISDGHFYFYDWLCPCESGSVQAVPSFVGNHYFCESGNPTNTPNILYTSDPLWDGQGCGSRELTCCSAPGLPWFHRDYGNTTTTDYIELRVCGTEGISNDDVPVSFYEIYVK